MGLVGWIPTVIGFGLRGVLYRLILRMDGPAAIENGVRLRFASLIRLGRRVYLDQQVYIHACPNGVTIGDETCVMHSSILHVYNFRQLPNAGIRIGRERPYRRVHGHPRPGRRNDWQPGIMQLEPVVTTGNRAALCDEMCVSFL